MQPIKFKYQKIKKYTQDLGTGKIIAGKGIHIPNHIKDMDGLKDSDLIKLKEEFENQFWYLRQLAKHIYQFKRKVSSDYLSVRNKETNVADRIEEIRNELSKRNGIKYEIKYDAKMEWLK